MFTKQFFWLYIKMLINIIFSIGLIAVGFESKAAPLHSEISRCFWVYAPMHELAKEMQLVQLQFFTQGRIGWLGGYNQANASNPQYINAFDANLEQGKSLGLLMKEDMRRSILSMDKIKYDEILSKATACDKIIGIETDFIPKIGK